MSVYNTNPHEWGNLIPKFDQRVVFAKLTQCMYVLSQIVLESMIDYYYNCLY